MPQVKFGSTVLIHYTAMLANGKVIESTAGGDPLRVTVGAGKILRGIEEALEGMSPGETRRLKIPPEKAYGKRKPGVSHHSLDAAAPFGKSPGNLQHQVMNAGSPDEFSVTTTDKGLQVDTNPQLAGEEITVDLEVIDIAT